MLRQNRRFNKKSSGASRDRWLITYADMITLLLVFFILMYTMSKIDAVRFDAIAHSLHKVMGGQGAILYDGAPGVSPGAYEPATELADEMLRRETQNLLSVKEQVEAYLKEHGLQDKVTVELQDRGLLISFQDVVLFPLGKATLSEESAAIVRDIGGILSQLNNYIRVEGHTDSLPINTTVFPSNWELSTARASRVVRELIDSNAISPERLSATGFGEYRPKRPNDSEENRRYNRRVDIVILRDRYSDIEPNKIISIEQQLRSANSN